MDHSRHVIEQRRGFIVISGLPGSGKSTLARRLSPALGLARGGFRFEVVDMDGNRVDRVLVARIPHPP